MRIRRLRLAHGSRLLLAAWAVLSPIDASGQDRRSAVDVVLSGVVRDEVSGRPLEGVSITIPAFGWHAKSDSRGHYQVRGEHGALDRLTTLDAFRPDFLPESRSLMLGCHWLIDSTTCELTLDLSLRPWSTMAGSSPVCTISGRILGSADGSGLEATVVVDGGDSGTVADAMGRFHLSGVPAGLQRVSASMIGMITVRRLVVVSCDSPGQGPEMAFHLIPLVVS